VSHPALISLLNVICPGMKFTLALALKDYISEGGVLEKAVG